MTIPRRKKTSKKKPSRRNPGFIDRILGKQKTFHDEASVTTDEGIIKIKGKEHLKIAQALDEALTLDLKDVTVTFTPRGSNRSYIINRPKDIVKVRETEEPRARRRSYGGMLA